MCNLNNNTKWVYRPNRNRDTEKHTPGYRRRDGDGIRLTDTNYWIEQSYKDVLYSTGNYTLYLTVVDNRR